MPYILRGRLAFVFNYMAVQGRVHRLPMKICTHSLHCLVQFLLSSHCLFISVVGSVACFYLWQSRDGIPSIYCSQGRSEGVLKGGGGG